MKGLETFHQPLTDPNALNYSGFNGKVKGLPDFILILGSNLFFTLCQSPLLRHITNHLNKFKSFLGEECAADVPIVKAINIAPRKK